MTHSPYTTAAVAGLGTMGAGIAQVIATAGVKVIALEADQDRLDAGLERLNSFVDGGVRRGKLTEVEAAAIRDAITGTVSVDDLADAEVVIEAVTEDLGVKHSILSSIAAVVGDDVPLLTNTSALSVGEIAAGVPGPSRVAGFHFFNPAPLMKTLEVVRAESTAAGLVDRLVEFGEAIGKDTIVVKDRPGFLINALLLPYLNDVIAEFDSGLAEAVDIDTAMKLGLGYKQGPLELLDLIGLDVHHHATSAAYESTKDYRYAPPPLLKAMVTAGRLGSKNGRGFRQGSDEA